MKVLRIRARKGRVLNELVNFIFDHKPHVPDKATTFSCDTRSSSRRLRSRRPRISSSMVARAFLVFRFILTAARRQISLR